MELLQNIKDKVILDVGCWDGTYLQQLTDLAPKFLLGLDRDSGGLKKAVHYQNSQPQLFRTPCITYYFKGNCNSLPFKNESIDHVVCGVTLYMLDQRYALKEVARVLKPDGFFTFTDHTIWYVFRRMVSSYEQPADTSRIKTVAGMLFIMFNGILYNFFGSPPLLRTFTDSKWYIYLDKKRLKANLLKNNLTIINYKILKQWRRHPILFQCTAQKGQT